MHILIDGEDGYNDGSIPTGQVARPALSKASTWQNKERNGGPTLKMTVQNEKQGGEAEQSCFCRISCLILKFYKMK